jgi:hypothetical protein
MRYLSVCAGIEAKACRKCGAVKPLSEYHRQASGPKGRHSWCKTCSNAAQKASRDKHGRPERKEKWLLKSRYGLTVERRREMERAQDGRCAICDREMKRACIDHDHATGKVRDLLCHGCNIKLPAVEDQQFRQRAIAYLWKHA